MGIADALTTGRAEIAFEGHTIAVESRTRAGIGNHHRLLVDGVEQDGRTTFMGDVLGGSFEGPSGPREFTVRVEQGVRTHYTLVVDGEDHPMGSSFVA